MASASPSDFILIEGARQNNLKGINLKLPLGELIVVMGVSGSGKSSLAFDTIYAEGQRRYVETFSPYARQFLDRMDKPKADRIDGIPPAIAIDQTNPVKTSRSTVGTMTELNDHLKLLFARAAQLFCRGCGKPVRRDTADSIFEQLLQIVAAPLPHTTAASRPTRLTGAKSAGVKPATTELLITFPVPIPKNFSEQEVRDLLAKQGYRKYLADVAAVVPSRDAVDTPASVRDGRPYTQVLEVVQDNVLFTEKNRARIVESLEAALKVGQGRVNIHHSTTPPLHHSSAPLRFSSDLHCPDCDIHYRDPAPNLFSFNSPIGACETCRGFGRTIGIDYGLVIPDDTKTLAGGAVKPWQTESYRECQDDLMEFAEKHGIPTDIPWHKLTDTQREWVIEGVGNWEDRQWYGVKRFFAWLETKSYKMHVRVLLSRYRRYVLCHSCGGARLKPEALLWRLPNALGVVGRLPSGGGEEAAASGDAAYRKKGLTIHDVMLLPISDCYAFFQSLKLPAPLDEAADLLLGEIRTRLRYLVEVGLGYLTLDRQSRTLSGGEVQRVNLTTALGTSLVNTLYVLDEPSIGLHPRDINRLISILHRLRDAGNTLLVVEHDPDVIRAADKVLDLGPGPGERGGEVVFFGTQQDLLKCEQSLTARYLRGDEPLVGTDRRAVRPLGAPGGRALPTDFLRITGAAEHNLKNIDVDIPLNRLVCLTGVSGSGKSTLVQDVLYKALCKLKHKPMEMAGKHKQITGHDQIEEVVLVDQSPVGRTTRSNPASYVGAFDAIRKLFAAAPLAKERSYTAGTFSFNSGEGRCPACGGNGFEHVEMQFLSDVYLRCPDCDGKRYRKVVLEVTIRKDGHPERSEGSRQPKSEIPRSARNDNEWKSQEHSPSLHHSTAPSLHSASIADVLDMTVNEACEFFAGHAEIQRVLQPLRAVGLGYIKLGQPVPTLSGGEAQRLKLAGHLAEANCRAGASPATASRQFNDGKRGARPTNTGQRRSLFLFDEPTTGLHFDDIATLLQALRHLIELGHSVVVIEHNLDVIREADWIIDLGPEGGEAGGEVVCVGTPQDVAKCERSHTGAALRGAWSGKRETVAETRSDYAERSTLNAQRNREICIHNAREHNLKSIDVRIPREKFTVITGISGSGKSTLAFDILFAEGQRRYLESLNAYARQFVQPASRPDVDAVFGIPPTVAIEQRTSRGGRKSTVATVTEIYHFLRLLFVKLGTQYCPDCDIPIQPQTGEAILANLFQQYRGQRVELLAPLIVARKGYYTDLAAWALRKGFSQLRVDGALLPTANWPRLDRFKEHNIELPVGALEVTPIRETELRDLLETALEFGKGVVLIGGSRFRATVVRAHGRAEARPSEEPEQLFSTRRACPKCGRSFEELDPRLFSFNSKHGRCPGCYGTGIEFYGFTEEHTGEEAWWNEWFEGQERPCPDCHGARLRPEAVAVRFQQKNIAEFAKLSVEDAADYFAKMKLLGREAAIARDLVAELQSRLAFLKKVGLPYLSLDRAAPTLSGGEAQRIRLAAQLGSNLRGVCYILDEPTIGLHPRDNLMLLDTLHELEAKGNTVVVVEHDEETIRHAEHIIDLGPGAGTNGGRVVAEGTLKDLMRSRESVTGQFLREPLRHPLKEHQRNGKAASSRRTPHIEIVRATLHNLKNVTVEIPLARFVCVTGVSGSGKSTLVREVVYRNLKELICGSGLHPRSRPVGVKAESARHAKQNPSHNKNQQWHGCQKILGAEHIARVLEVDQAPIGKTPRSCPATYVGFWDDIRRLFAGTTEAKMRGYGPSRFSFNVAGGRCEECEGQGMKKIKMSFLPDVSVACESCRGKRFTPETLEVKWKEKSIGDVLAMSMEEAAEFFAAQSHIHRGLKLLQEVGLGYLTLGQQSPTLSGGEAQRIKLVTELAKAGVVGRVPSHGAASGDAAYNSRNHTLYVLDEPTIGLHMADVEKLIRVLHRLVDAGNTVIVIEHNLDIIAEADWMIDLGPEGGDGGGRIVAQGTPQQVAREDNGSHTAKFLKRFLRGRRSRRDARASLLPTVRLRSRRGR
jgi:excinuclease ABC subunit A